MQSFLDVIARLPGYEVRPTQLQMVAAVDLALKDRKHLLIEAGTGSGKSFGYLFPLLEQGVRAVVSTGTIALQEQILHKDIPFLQQARVFTAAMAKGRHHYICHTKLAEADRILPPHDPMRNTLMSIQQHLPDWEGDSAELPFSIERPLWDELFSSGEDSLGPRCEHFTYCPARVARAKLGEVDLIITNHALYMSDLASGGGILPPHDLVVFDEAHHLPAAAAQAFTVTIGRFATTKLLQKIRRKVSSVPDRLTVDILDAEAGILDWVLTPNKPTYRLFPDSDFYGMVDRVLHSLTGLRVWLHELDTDRLPFPDPLVASKAALHRVRLEQQLANLISRWQCFSAAGSDEERVNWVDTDTRRGYFELKSTPLDVADLLAKELWSQKTTILASATLAVGKDFSYIRRQLGLDSGNEMVLASPFDYPEQVALFLPAGLPDPNAPDFIKSCVPHMQSAIEMAGGRSLLLFSSRRAMDEAWTHLQHLDYPMAKQGDLPPRRLVDWFKSTDGAVLLAMATFWEGIDVPGEALSCLIIEKVPFAAPDNPVTQAKVEKMKANGQDWFKAYMLPEAITRLRQGFGRLIRSRSDKGLVVILDSRLTTRGYGRQVLNALPPAQRIARLDLAAPYLPER
ncbi:MAG: ATP-dependent DNA helicase [Candidatus Sericytochromatia bacterium]|nr:ATP-dependent DNA helicase [Candidatus Sericytochromatia bacterium]